jgi:hypothetical protein
MNTHDNLAGGDTPLQGNILSAGGGSPYMATFCQRARGAPMWKKRLQAAHVVPHDTWSYLADKQITTGDSLQ